MTRLSVNEASDIAHVTIDGETIDATTTHPFYVEGYGFKPARELTAGDKVLLLNGETKEIEDVTLEHLREPVKVYNFEVEDWHTYYVAELGVLVHNTGCGTTSGTESPALKNSPYNPDVVNERIKPDYVPNPAHDASSNLYNSKKTPEPSDARDVYNNAVRGGMGEWYGVNGSGEIYQFFYDRNAGVHFAGIISKQDLARKNSSLIELLGISMKGKR